MSGAIPVTCSQVFEVVEGPVDECGVCHGDSSSCLGCDDVPNSGAVLDVCGECGGDGLLCAGCDGVSNSGVVFDACGVCGGDGLSCAGCDGVALSGATTDSCGICQGSDDHCVDPYELKIGRAAGVAVGNPWGGSSLCWQREVAGVEAREEWSVEVRWSGPSNHTRLRLKVEARLPSSTLGCRVWKQCAPSPDAEGVEQYRSLTAITVGTGFAGCSEDCVSGTATLHWSPDSLRSCLPENFDRDSPRREGRQGRMSEQVDGGGKRRGEPPVTSSARTTPPPSPRRLLPRSITPSHELLDLGAGASPMASATLLLLLACFCFALVSSIHPVFVPGFPHRVFRIKPTHNQNYSVTLCACITVSHYAHVWSREFFSRWFERVHFRR